MRANFSTSVEKRHAAPRTRRRRPDAGMLAPRLQRVAKPRLMASLSRWWCGSRDEAHRRATRAQTICRIFKHRRAGIGRTLCGSGHQNARCSPPVSRKATIFTIFGFTEPLLVRFTRVNSHTAEMRSNLQSIFKQRRLRAVHLQMLECSPASRKAPRFLASPSRYIGMVPACTRHP